LAKAIINADGLILGRLASVIAKRLLSGEEIVITNAEKAIIIGARKMVIDDYQAKRKLTHSRKGPKFPRLPDRILKRTIRGMLPYQQSRGRTALKRLKVYIGIPKEYKRGKAETVERAKNITNEKFIKLGEISRYLGAKLPVNE
jgi:large subunit ribosomal protein L13